MITILINVGVFLISLGLYKNLNCASATEAAKNNRNAYVTVCINPKCTTVRIAIAKHFR